jgi:carotenoid cleavage dioxygenase-like enzyme
MMQASQYPDSFDFHGFNAPVRTECSVRNLPVEGAIPDEIDGAFFRATADPAQVPFVSEDTMLSGDGMISRFSISGGHVDFAIRYVETERYLAERTARKALFGAYRNPYTDDPSVRGVDRTVANTTPVWHAGRLFMTKEDGLPYEINPHTLETIGRWDYGGRLGSRTFTAHPKIDPQTGELFFFGYEAEGLCTSAVSYCIANGEGQLVSEKRFDQPYCSLLHDFAITENYALFPVFPTTTDLKRVEAGGAYWIHEPERPSWIGVMPRYGSPEEMTWLKGPNGISGFHIMNAFESGEGIHLDLNVMETNVFPFIRAASGIDKSPAEMRAQLVRWTIDLARAKEDPSYRYEERVIGPPGDMPRMADADVGRPYRYGYYATFDPSAGPPNIHGVVGAGFNTLLKIEVGNGRIDALSVGPDKSVSEPVHIASKAAEHEGWLALVVDTHSTMSSELWILEAGDVAKGAIAKVGLPLRLRPQIHGTWVSADKLAAACISR